MLAPLIARLRHFDAIEAQDLELLERAAGRVRRLGAHESLVREGDAPRVVHFLLSGYTCRYKVLGDGRRQITALVVPGDSCDLHGLLLQRMDHGVVTLSSCTVAQVSRDALLELAEERPGIARALWWTTLVDEAILREWIGNIGRRTASQRIAHLFCELLVRLQAVGLAPGNAYEFPMTQAELADAAGLSTVHVNRTLQELRGAGVIALRGKQLTVVDVERLKAMAGFDPAYLHLAPPQAH